MKGVIMNLDLPVPGGWDEELMRLVVHEQGDLVGVGGVVVDDQAWEQVDWGYFSRYCAHEAPSLAVVQLDYRDVGFHDVFVDFGVDAQPDWPDFERALGADVDL